VFSTVYVLMKLFCSQSDSNIISHASPVEGSCHSVDSRTGALFLVTGGGAAGAVYFGIVP